VRLNGGDTELRANVAKSQVEDSPGFDKDEFAKLAAEDTTRLDAMIAGATGAGRPDSDDYYRIPQGWDAGAPR
jgi:hypothetical protein